MSKESARTLSKIAVTKVMSLFNSSLEVFHQPVSLIPIFQSDHDASKPTVISHILNSTSSNLMSSANLMISTTEISLGQLTLMHFNILLNL